MSKVITLKIDGHYIAVSDRVLGATGASAATTLRIIFDASWSETSKRVYFTDARGVSPVSMLLTTTMLIPQTEASVDMPETYEVAVPAEVMSYPGTADITIQGVVDEDGDGIAEKVMQTVSAQFTVLDGSVPCGVAIKKPSVDEMLQIQGQIDKIKADIVRASAAADAVEDASEAAREAETHAATASQKAEEAAESAAGMSAAAERVEAAKLAAEKAAADAADAVAAVEAAAGRAESAASQAASAAESAVNEAMAKLRELCVLKITFDGLFTPGSEYTVSCTDEHSSGEVKTLSVPESLQAEVYCHTETGYAVSCVDETGRVRAATITTGHDFGEYEVTLVGSHRVPWETATPDNAASLFVMAVEEEDVLNNPTAWDALTLDVVNEKMRFRGGERGDFFSDEVQSEYTGGEIEFDGREEAEKLLAPVTSVDNVKSWMLDIIRHIRASASGTTVDEEVIEILSWERMQYILLHGSPYDQPHIDLSPMLPEYKNRYWWRTRDVRYTSTVSYTDAEGVEHTRPTATTMDDMRSQLEAYANATDAAKEQAEEKFRVWFTRDTTVDLVLKRTSGGGYISAGQVPVYADKLLAFADEHKKTGAAFADITWSQITVAIIRSIYDTKKGAQAYTYGDAYAWRYNAWAEPQCAWIFTVADLINAVQNEDYEGLDSFADLCNPKVCFRADELFDGAGDVHSVLTGIKTEYEATGGVWANLAQEQNLDSAWYLIQYYLYNGGFVTDGTNILEDTATAGRTIYYWKDGWSENGWTRHAAASRVGVVDFEFLREAANSGVPARLNRMRTNGPETWQSRGLRDKTWGTPSWTEIVDTIGRSNPGSNTALWTLLLQFMMIHEDADNAAAIKFAYSESTKFYWWMNTAGPVYVLPTAGGIMESVLRRAAAGDYHSNVASTENICRNIGELNIRRPDETSVNRGELGQYDDAELLTVALRSLMTTVYEKVAEANAPSGYETWDFVTADGVFTYNAAAYEAVKSLDAYAIQHWLATGGTSYEPTDDEKASYWWIEREYKIDLAANFRTMVVNLLGFSLSEYDRTDAMKMMLRAEWGNYGFSESAESVIKYEYITLADIKTLFSTAKTSYNWAQFEYLARNGSIYSAAKATLQAKKDGITIPKQLAATLSIPTSEIAAARNSRTLYDMKALFVKALRYATAGNTDALNQLLADEWGNYGFSATAETAATMLTDCIGDMLSETDNRYSWAQMELLCREEVWFDVDTVDECIAELGIVVPEQFDGHITIDLNEIFAAGGEG